MTELRFHRSVYVGEAVDEATKTFANFADFELSEGDDHWVVAVTPKPEYEGAARRIIGEFANFVLGLTVDRGGVEANP